MKLILDAARNLVDGSAVQTFRTDLAAIQAQHTQSLFEVANELLERTVLNPGFHGQLRAMLAADGYDANTLDGDPTEAFEEADRLWEILASEA